MSWRIRGTSAGVGGRTGEHCLLRPRSNPYNFACRMPATKGGNHRNCYHCRTCDASYRPAKFPCCTPAATSRNNPQQCHFLLSCTIFATVGSMRLLCEECSYIPASNTPLCCYCCCLIVCVHNPFPLPQSLDDQLDALLDNSPVLAPARLKRHKEAAAAAAAAKDEQHRRQLKRWSKLYHGMRAERDELRQQLSAHAGQHLQQTEATRAGTQAGQQAAAAP
jgi:hypothetical protein